MIRFVLVLLFLPLAAMADGVRLHAPQPLIETDLMRHILPRFTLKTQVRVTLVDEGDAADIALGPAGRPLWHGAGATWHLTVSSDTPEAARFADWLTSEVGRNTVLSFAPEGTAPFSLARAEDDGPAIIEYAGDATLGLTVSQEKCARCHAVEAGKSMNDIGSTPSFPLLRTLPDWEERFTVFYVLKPHGAFTMIEDVTPPFPEDRPSPIVPIQLTLDEVEAVTAYVAALEAADLGAPLQHQ